MFLLLQGWVSGIWSMPYSALAVQRYLRRPNFTVLSAFIAGAAPDRHSDVRISINCSKSSSHAQEYPEYVTVESGIKEVWFGSISCRTGKSLHG